MSTSSFLAKKKIKNSEDGKGEENNHIFFLNFFFFVLNSIVVVKVMYYNHSAGSLLSKNKMKIPHLSVLFLHLGLPSVCFLIFSKNKHTHVHNWLPPVNETEWFFFVKLSRKKKQKRYDKL